MDKRIKRIVIVVAIVLVLVLFFNRDKNEDNKIVKYLIKADFASYNDTSLYKKQISEYNLEQYNKGVDDNIDSEYEVMYFNIDTYRLTKDKISYSDGITKNFTPEFDYMNDKLSYTYRINFSNTNVIIEGIYNIKTNEFTCEPTFVYQFEFESSKEDICNKVKLDVEDFEYEVKQLIPNVDLLNYMKKKDNN